MTPGKREEAATLHIDSKTTPILLSVRHWDRQWRAMPSTTKSKRDGNPKVVDTRKAAPAFEKLRTSLALSPQDCGFMGDEVVDLPVLERCGFACAPPEAREAVLARVHYVAAAAAGRGAAREVCEFVMRAQGTLERALQGRLA